MRPLFFSILSLSLISAGCQSSAPSVPAFSPSQTQEITATLRADPPSAAAWRKLTVAAEQDVRFRIVNLTSAQSDGYKKIIPDSTGHISPDALLRDMSQGSVRMTGNVLDCAITGEGFFCLKGPDMEHPRAYTRRGNFTLDKDGLVVLSGQPAWALEPPIKFPFNTTGIAISSDGRVFYTDSNSTTPQQIAQMQLFHFIAPQQLRSTDGVLFYETEASGSAVVSNPGLDGDGTLVSSALESSNVSRDEEMAAIESLSRWHKQIEKISFSLPTAPAP